MGRSLVTKHPGTGGRVTVAGVTEQLVYEIGDPQAYITPDCIADFTTIRLEQAGPDRVRFSGIRGATGDGVLQGLDQLFRRLQGDRLDGVRVAGRLQEGAGRGPHSTRSDWSGWA